MFANIHSLSALSHSPKKVTLLQKAHSKSSSNHSNLSMNTQDSDTLTCEQEQLFIERKFKPYLAQLFQDLALRSSSVQGASQPNVDKNTFCGYVNLPGLVGERFFALACSSSKDRRVDLEFFQRLILDVYSKSNDEKARLAFRIYDFNSDGRITPDDVMIILNHLPISALDNN